MNQLLNYLSAIYPLSEELRVYLQAHIKQRAIAKKELLLKAGHICRNICFIEKGLLRCFYLKEGTEVSSWFMREGDVIISVESFFDQKPSYEAIQALEHTVVWYISFQELEFIYKNFMEFNYVGRVLVQHYYKLSEQRLYSMRLQTATERYHFLLQHFPEIIQRVSTADIASYLGITRETLSRIKKNRQKSIM